MISAAALTCEAGGRRVEVFERLTDDSMRIAVCLPLRGRIRIRAETAERDAVTAAYRDWRVFDTLGRPLRAELVSDLDRRQDGLMWRGDWINSDGEFVARSGVQLDGAPSDWQLTEPRRCPAVPDALVVAKSVDGRVLRICFEHE